jgi:hypothetical protein
VIAAGDVLVVGSLPPPCDERRSSLLEKVLELKASGREVTVLSADPLAVAHHYLPATGVVSALGTFAKGRRFAEVVLQIEPGLPVRGRAGRLERAAALTALAAALGRLGRVTLRLDHPDDLVGGYGGRPAVMLWQQADRIEVGSEEVGKAITGLLGEGAADVVVVARRPVGSTPRPDGDADWQGAEAMTAADVVTVVRKRAAERRTHLADAGLLQPASSDGITRVPQWEWLPAPGAGVPDLGAVPRKSPAPSPLRKVATPMLVAAERHAWSRLAAHAALSVYRGLRSPGRPPA